MCPYRFEALLWTEQCSIVQCNAVCVTSRYPDTRHFCMQCSSCSPLQGGPGFGHPPPAGKHGFFLARGSRAFTRILEFQTPRILELIRILQFQYNLLVYASNLLVFLDSRVPVATIFNVTTTRWPRSLVAPPQRGAGGLFYFCLVLLRCCKTRCQHKS